MCCVCGGVLLLLCIFLHLASEGYCRVVPIAVNAFEGGDLAVLVAVSFCRAFGASEIALLALVGTVGELIAFVTLCDWKVLFYVCVVMWDYL